MFEYLATPTTELGSLGWLFFSAQVLALLAGAYLLFLQAEPHPIRGPLLRRLGYLLVGLGVVGVALGAARLLALGPLTVRGWFYILALVELAAAAYVVYFQQTIYPQQMADYRASARRGTRPPARPSPSAIRSNGTPTEPPQPRPEPITGRRASRRERKRRK